MILNRENLDSLENAGIVKPSANIFDLPEKVLQFGTGVLLRGLPDYFIDKANRQGIFNGRVVVVKSTNHGSTQEFDNQDNLYTLCINGIENGKTIQENIVNSAISRVLTAGTQWEEILNVAASEALEVVISNTTEVGIQYLEEDIKNSPPESFPGKLLAILYHRFKTFNGDKDKGLVIVPTELIVDNATKLEEIIVRLAKTNNLPDTFLNWLKDCNYFCNSLVDCIVPGKPDAKQLAKTLDDLGYEDDLLVMSEVYRLWAISGNDKVKEKLSFAQADSGVVITPDIDLHRELKLRLLNGTHTLSCGIAFLAGFDTVKSTMDDDVMENFIANLMRTELALAIPYPVTKEQTEAFSLKVLDRFRNPHIDHQWLSITANFSSKLRMRVLPVLINFVEKFKSVPEYMSIGFAAYIRFMKPFKNDNGKYYGEINGREYLINDTKADYLSDLWANNPDDIVYAVLKDTELWGSDLAALPGFKDSVSHYLKSMDNTLAIRKSIKIDKAKFQIS
jgi:tagaturonate reductase